MNKKISQAERDRLRLIAEEIYPKLPREIAQMCNSEEELYIVNNCNSKIPFYRLGMGDKDGRADRMRESYNKSVDKLRDIVNAGAHTLGDKDRLDRALSLLDEAPSFPYATDAGHRQRFLDRCKREMTSFGKVRGEAIRSLLSYEFDIDKLA